MDIHNASEALHGVVFLGLHLVCVQREEGVVNPVISRWQQLGLGYAQVQL